LIGVNDTGDARIVRTDGAAHQASLDGFTLYSARDMYMFVTLNDRDRRMLHEFKQRFGGTVEWRTED
jgi:hypothetical protein